MALALEIAFVTALAVVAVSLVAVSFASRSASCLDRRSCWQSQRSQAQP